MRCQTLYCGKAMGAAIAVVKRRASMDLSNIADIADLIAALAIVASLAFVGFELHMTRKQSELSNRREVLQTFTDYKAATNDIAFAAFLVRAHEDYEALNPAKKNEFWVVSRTRRSHPQQFSEA